MTIDIPPPQLQVDFALALEQIRATYLQDALSAAAASLDTATIDSELARFVPGDSLSQLAGHGLRGELMFAVPCVLRKNPRLLGYYRLLLGFSQKAFYGIAGVGRFRSMENSGRLNKAQEHALSSLCSALTAASAALLDGIGARRISRELLDDLALLTVGPQLRGGYNVRAGTAGIVRVFDAIAAIVSHAAAKTEPQLIELKTQPGGASPSSSHPIPIFGFKRKWRRGAFATLSRSRLRPGWISRISTTALARQKKAAKRRRPTATSSAGQSSTWTGWI